MLYDIKYIVQISVSEIRAYFDGFFASIPNGRDTILSTRNNWLLFITSNRRVQSRYRSDSQTIILVFQGDWSRSGQVAVFKVFIDCIRMRAQPPMVSRQPTLNPVPCGDLKASDILFRWRWSRKKYIQMSNRRKVWLKSQHPKQVFKLKNKLIKVNQPKNQQGFCRCYQC